MKLNAFTLSNCLVIATILYSQVVIAQTVAPNPTAPITPTTPVTQNMDFATELAKADLAKQGIAEPTKEQMAAALKGIQDQRASGLGWGQIAASLGLNLGHVVSAVNRSSKAKAEGSGVTGSTGNGSAAGNSNSNAGGNGNAGGKGGSHGGGGKK